MLASGDHIVHLARDDFYVPILQDKESLNLDLVIESESGEKDVTIYNKIKGVFRIPISKSLIFRNIIIDSVDSFIPGKFYFNSYLLVSDANSCLESNQRCCKVEDS